METHHKLKKKKKNQTRKHIQPTENNIEWQPTHYTLWDQKLNDDTQFKQQRALSPGCGLINCNYRKAS